MKYIPHLIPEHARVLPGYFKIMPAAQPSSRGNLGKILLWILGIFFGLLALATLIHPLLSLLWALCCLIILPPGHRFLERKLRFRLTPTIKTFSLLFLIAGAFILGIHYAVAEHGDALQQQTKEKQEQAAQAIVDRNKQAEQALYNKTEQQRIDSIALLLQQSRQSIEARRWNEASSRLQQAQQYARNNAERNEIGAVQIALQTGRSQELIKGGKYQAALTLIDSLFTAGAGNTKLRYNRALCCSKTGKTAEAVAELKSLMKDGNGEAERLHEKINPLRKKVVGYETLCCDGTTSGARGRGACSHHGGVCDWNHPIYEEYRKYE